MDDLVGFFVNTLVLRTDTSGRSEPARTDRPGALGNLAAYSHQDVPFERLVEVINPQRSLSRHPLFQVMLAFQNNAAVELELDGVSASFEPVASQTSKFDLALSLLETRSADGSAAGIAGSLEYATDLFDRSSMTALVERLVRLLEASCADADAPLASLDILGEAERRALLEEFNATSHAVPAASLPGAVRGAGARDAGRDCRGVRGSRAELRGAGCARQPSGASPDRARGSGPRASWALCVERSLEMVIGLLGILKAGAAYLPLDPSYPAERLSFMLADAGAGVVVTQQGLIDRLPVLAGVAGGDAARRPTTDLPVPLPTHLRGAWCVSTPTGAPSRCGPSTPRRCASNPATPPTSSTHPAPQEPQRASWCSMGASPILRRRRSSALPLPRNRGVLQFASPSFDAAVSEIATALLLGSDPGDAAGGRAQR